MQQRLNVIGTQQIHLLFHTELFIEPPEIYLENAARIAGFSQGIFTPKIYSLSPKINYFVTWFQGRNERAQPATIAVYHLSSGSKQTQLTNAGIDWVWILPAGPCPRPSASLVQDMGDRSWLLPHPCVRGCSWIARMLGCDSCV